MVLVGVFLRQSLPAARGEDVRFQVVVRVNAGVVLALGLALLVPLALSLLYRDGSWESFLLPAVGMLVAGTMGVWATRLRRSSPGQAVEYLSNRDVYLSVTLAWTLAALLGGVPFVIEGTFHSILASTFEAMSGFTTTGATLLSDIEAQTPSILFWRSLTQWLGGVGIVVLFVAVSSRKRVGGASWGRGSRGSPKRHPVPAKRHLQRRT